MGNYLGKPAPPQPASTSEARDLRERPGRRPPPIRPTPPPAPSGHTPGVHTHPSLPTPLPRPSRRTALRGCGPVAHRFVITPRRRYPIQQAQYASLGVLPTVCWNSCHKKTVLSARSSKMVCSPVRVRIAPPDSKWIRPPLSEQSSSSTVSSPSASAPDPCAKETVLSALRARKKRTVKEEDQILADGQEEKRRRQESSGRGHSAFEPLAASGIPASFVPKPGSLKRGLSPQSSDAHLNKRSRTSSLSSLTSTYSGGMPISSRNAITSSYSSTGGLSQLRKRRGPSSSPFSSPASSCSQALARPAKKIREEELSHHSASSTPFTTDKESQGAEVADTTTREKQNSWSSPPTPGSSGRRKRKVQLLRSWRGEQLTLPPPPQLGYSVTAEDLDLEKKALLQWFSEILEDKTDTALSAVPESPPTSQPPVSFSPPTAGTPATETSLPAPSPNPLLKSLKKKQDSPGLPSLPKSAGMATPVAHSPPKTPSPLAPLGSSQSGPLAGTSSDSQSTAVFCGDTLTPASSIGPVTDTKSPPAPQAETSAKSQALSAPPPTPKQNIPCGMLSTSPAKPPASAAPAVSSPSPVLDPIFWPPPKSKNEGPLPSSPSKVPATTSSSSALPATTRSPSLTFKPGFHTREAPASVPMVTPFFKQAAPPASAMSAPLFPGQTGATSAVAAVTTAGTSVDSALKPVFSFCLSSMTSTLSSVTSTTASTSQPFLFGTPSASGASFTNPAVGSSSIVQLGKPPTMPPSRAVTSFGQSLPGAPQAVASSSSSSSTAGFSDLGSSLPASAPATTSQATLTFSSTPCPAISIPFGSSAKPSLSSYPGSKAQPRFGATDGQQQWAAKPSLVPSLCSSFTLGNSAAPAPTATPAAAQPAFGSTTAVFSFGAATTSGFGATAQTTGSGASRSSSTTPSPFTFGGWAAPPSGSRGFGISVASPGTSSASGASGSGARQSGTAGSTTPFVGGLSQKSLGAPSQNTSFALNVACTAESKRVFGGASTPTFGQSTPGPGVGTSGSSLSFRASSTPIQGFVRKGPSFSIGVGSKPPGAWQRLQARRQHTSKK
ncbi:LOW QUALITY PROTEIN: nuclear envelope pore membrane protein POM 121C-like [Phacochoerus africanus]|uniref:LOW QUALITY PROTEIN: nuclear envelope pore membrane protein POM 121C-like n=1 Tax=Phacochoerus africanus TaxID=41426 RepID=UPI001FD95ABA|nr:LOW QUALITY PROTEIN: nuclear envelope pore membrane protein POM 121C-like [Phacochoerus africanus]